MNQIAIPAVWMRGGTSKGLFFRERDLPADPNARDALLLAAIGSPDPYRSQIDGIGGATSSTSKIAIIAPAEDPDYDVSYLFGHVAIDRPVIDYSGNCGNLSAAVGVFAIEQGLVPATDTGITSVRVWQCNLQKPLIIRVPVQQGMPSVAGDFRMAGVASAGAPILVDFVDPGGGPGGQVLPTGNPVDRLRIPGVGEIEASLVNAGNATVFIRASDLGLKGTELPPEVDADQDLLALCELIRCEGAVAMGSAPSVEHARQQQPAVPKIAFISPPQENPTSNGDSIPATELDLCARILSMGRLHHAFTGTGTIALAVAAAVPGTLVAECLRRPLAPDRPLRFGHPKGTIEVGAEVRQRAGHWTATRASFRRTARTLMQGQVLVPRQLTESPRCSM